MSDEIDGYTVVGYVKSISTDEEGRAKLTFMIPPNHLQDATKIALWTKQLLHITVMRNLDVRAHFQRADHTNQTGP